jgi:hypothetical protein
MYGTWFYNDAVLRCMTSSSPPGSSKNSPMLLDSQLQTNNDPWGLSTPYSMAILHAMQRPIPSKVPNPVFPSIRDITLYTLSYLWARAFVRPPILRHLQRFLHSRKEAHHWGVKGQFLTFSTSWTILSEL